MSDNGRPTPVEEIAVDLTDIIEKMVDLQKRLINELAQYRVMDEEERELQALVDRMGGGRK